MATKLAEAFVEIKIDDRNVSKRLRNAKGQFVKLGNAAATASGNVLGLDGKMRDASGRFVKMGGAAQSAQKNVAGLGRSFASLGKIASVAGGIIASQFIMRITQGLASVIPTFAKFESTMIRVGGVTNTLATRDFALLEAAARKAGATTRFTASESASAMEALGLAGLSTREIMASLPGALQLASAAQIDIATSASIAAKTMKAFGLEATDIGRINDTLVSTFTRSNTTILQLAEALKPVGPVAKAAGVSLEDTSAILAKMADAGFSGSLGGTALRNALIRLASPSKNAATILKKLGVEGIDPLFVKLEKLQAGIEGASGETEKLQIASEVFGIRGGPAMLAVLDSGVISLRDFSAELTNAGGIAKRLEQAQLKTLTGQFDLLRSAVEGSVLQIGQALNPAMMGMLKIGQALVPEMVKFTAVLAAAAIGVGIVTVAVKLFTIAQRANAAASAFALALLGPAGWAKIAAGIIGATIAIVAMESSLSAAGVSAKKAAGEIANVKGPAGAGGKSGSFKTVGDFAASSRLNVIVAAEAKIPKDVDDLINFRKEAKSKGISVDFDLFKARQSIQKVRDEMDSLGRSGEAFRLVKDQVERLDQASLDYAGQLMQITIFERKGHTDAITGARERLAAQERYNKILLTTRDTLKEYGESVGLIATPEPIAAGEKLTNSLSSLATPVDVLKGKMAEFKRLLDVGAIGFVTWERLGKKALDGFDEAIGGPEAAIKQMNKELSLVGASAKDKFLARHIEGIEASGESAEKQAAKIKRLGDTFDTLEAAKEAEKKKKKKPGKKEERARMSFVGITQLSQQIQASVGLSNEQKEARKTAKNTESIAESSKTTATAVVEISKRHGGLA